MMKSSRENTGEEKRMMEGGGGEDLDRLEAAGRENACGKKKINWMKRKKGERRFLHEIGLQKK